jgi:hypothetical protein
VREIASVAVEQHGADDVSAMFASTPILTGAGRRFLHLEPAALAGWAIAALVRAGAARVDGAMLLNRD